MADPNALDVLEARGFVAQVTDADALRSLLDEPPVSFYYGVDPTAPSLHVGNLVGLMAMAWLQRTGHRAIALAGGATGAVGDPSGHSSERQLLDDERLRENLAGIRRQLSQILDLDGRRGILVDNHDWLGELGLLPFLRDVGKHVSVNAMIARESVRARLETREQGISLTEFSYQLLQAYDFAHLYAAEDCRLQIGGSDQWGNIVAGIDLVRRLHDGSAHGLVWPLVERSDGRKMGKTAGGGTLWLDPDLTSPYRYYQWFLNIPDADVVRFLGLFTFLDLAEIDELAQEVEERPAEREAQRMLAREATRILHGPEALREAERTSEILFGDEPYRDLDDATLRDAFRAAPSVEVERGRLSGDGVGLLTLMREVGAADSNSEARRLVEQGAVRLNNDPVDDPTRYLGPGDLAGRSTLVLRVGRRRHYLARFT